MPLLTTTRLYADGDLLLDTDFDAFINDIETFLNITKVDGTNIVDLGITASQKVANATITSAKLVSNIATTAKFADSSVTEAKLATNAVTEDKFADSAVVDANIPDDAITVDKLIASETALYHKLSVADYFTVGTYGWTVPAGIYQIHVEGCSGGGAGGGGGGYAGGGGGGGGASYVQHLRLDVTPGAVLTVIVGAGGGGGAGGFGTANGVAGGNGNPTSIASIQISPVGNGGGGGIGNTSGANDGIIRTQNPGTGGDFSGVTGSAGFRQQPNNSLARNYMGGAGGAGGSGGGMHSSDPSYTIALPALVGSAGVYTQTSWSNNTSQAGTGAAAGAGFGAGGGGGGGGGYNAAVTSEAPVGGAGGRGGQGFLRIYY